MCTNPLASTHTNTQRSGSMFSAQQQQKWTAQEQR